MMWLRLRLFPMAVLWLLLVHTHTSTADRALVLAVHPYLPVAEIHQRFAAFANYLSEATGMPVNIRVGGDYEEHIIAVGTDKVDMAFLGPAAYVSVVEQYGAKPLLARFELADNPRLFGVIATRRDSGLTSLQQLADKRFAFGDPKSTMSHIVPRYMMMQAGITAGLPASHHFLGSHKNVALGVLAGDYDAGAMKKEVFVEFESRGLRALATSPGVPDHVFVARTDLPAAQIEVLRQAMAQLHTKAGGKEILTGMHKELTALVPAHSEDYDELRRMMQAVEQASR